MTPLKLGNIDIGAVYLGNTPINKIYVGTNLIFEIGGDYYELIEDVTISVATTSVTFSGFTATKEDSLVLVSDVYNPIGSLTTLKIYANNNQTATNYYAQELYVQGINVPSVRLNNSQFSAIPSGYNSFVSNEIKITNDGFFTSQANGSNEYNKVNEIDINDYYVSSTFTVTSITQLDIVASIANSIGIGSRFQLYKKVN